MSAAAFEAVVGAAHVAAGAGGLDAARIEWVVTPASAEEVAACLAVASELDLPVVPRGGGSRLHWGNPLAARRVVVLDTIRMVRPLDLQPDEGIADLAAGVRVAEVQRALSECKKLCLLDPFHPASTVGGVVAADPIGLEYSLDRRLRGDLLGIEVVGAAGRIARAGGRVVKNVTGFDLVRLHCGALGSLGVITRVTLRLRALPDRVCVLRRTYPDIGAGLEAAGALRAAGVEPAGAALRRAGPGCELLWLLEGRQPAVARAEARFPGDPLSARDWEELRARLDAPEREGQVALRLAARPSDSAVLCTALAAHGGAPRLVLPLAGVVFGDLPERGLHPLLAEAAASGWALFVERAALEVRERIDVFGPEPAGLALMRALKRRFDPHGRLAPGRFVGRC